MCHLELKVEFALFKEQASEPGKGMNLMYNAMLHYLLQLQEAKLHQVSIFAGGDFPNILLIEKGEADCND